MSDHKRRRQMSLGLTAVALAAVIPLLARGFAVQGPVWANQAGQPVPFTLSPAGSDDINDGADLAAVRSAFATWQAVSCSFLGFAEQPWAGEAVVSPDGVNRVFWVEDAAVWPSDDTTLALTFNFYDGQGGIIDADIIFNGVHQRWTTDATLAGEGAPDPLDIESVALHEVGHFFGLNHSTDPEAAMFQNNRNKPVQRDPATDDIQGICTLYSNGQPVPGDPVGSAPVGSPCDENEDCASDTCLLDERLQRAYCTRICVATPAPGDCPAGFFCEELNDGNSYCVAPAPVEELCDQCSNHEQCASGLCVTVPNVNNLQPFCSRACDPTPGQPQTCPSGYQCVQTRQAATLLGTCVPNTGVCDPQGLGGQDEPCFANGTCKAGHRCVAYPGSGLSFCYADCPFSARGLNCGRDDLSCQALDSTDPVAACFTFRTVGEPCIPEVCDSRSFCAWDESVDSALCYQRCAQQSDCPANTQCLTFDGLPSLCVPNSGFRAEGETCLSDEECSDDPVPLVCRPFGAVELCTRSCVPSDPMSCREGFECYPTQDGRTGFCGPPNIAPPPVNAGVNDCACDRTFECDSDCDCDPECTDSCGCTSVSETSGLPWATWALLLALAVWRRRQGR